MKKKYYKMIIFLLLVQICALFYIFSKKGEEKSPLTKAPLIKSPLNIDETHRATGYDNRIKGVVLHYTVLNNEDSLRVLTKKNVSSHYLVTDEDKDPIYSLVDEDKRAWHAGKSSFMGRTNLNDTTVGIEIVNPGTQPSKNGEKNYVPYTEGQIEKVAQLVKHVVEKYDIEPKMVLGHSDIAPGRKPDPGPLFPWKHLYDQYNIGAWYDEIDKMSFMNLEDFSKVSIADIKKEFNEYGYTMPDTEVWDSQSIDVVRAFQLHFRPENFNGEMDLETYAILKALNKKYS